MHQSTIAGLLLSISLSTLALSSITNAATVEKVRGSLAIVAFDAADGTPAIGAKFFAMENGKKKAILEVVQFKNGKAKVKIAKGKAKEGMSVTAVGARKSKGKDEGDQEAATADAADSARSGKKRSRSVGGASVFRDMTVGVVVGYNMDSQNVTVAGSTAQAMTGSGYSGKGFVDIPVAGTLDLYTRAGVEQFSVASSGFKTDIMYATVDLLLKYGFTEGTFVPFVMGGLGLHFPVSKTSNILNINQISSTTVFYGGAGVNWLIGGSTYLQITGEYGMFPPSNDVSTSFIAANAGLGFRF